MSVVNWIFTLISKGTVILSLLIALTLGGCVRYQTTVDFHSFNSGDLIQHITIDPQFYQINQQAIDTWLGAIEQRAAQVNGRVTKPSLQELTVIVPFHRASELVAKFNQFFASSQQALASKLSIVESNFLLASRYQLTYDIDLSSLSPTIAGLEPSSSQAPDFQFALQAPGFPHNPATAGHWQLQLGQANHLVTTFWIPNPLGIGGLFIAIWVGVGYWLKSVITPRQLVA
jgi:Protein of unknown function (DUF3153)